MKEKLKILKTTSLLLVEDNIKLREDLYDILSFYVKKVYQASDGNEALNINDNNKIDLIFTDVNMAGLNGLDLVKQIREKNSTIPIVVISAFAEKDMLLEFMKMNLTEYIEKPVKHVKLLNVLENCANTIAKQSKPNYKLSENIYYERTTKSILNNSDIIILSKKEAQLLELFLSNPNTMVTKEIIEHEVYPEKDMSDSALKNLLSKLRKKIVADLISTIGTHGYMIIIK